MSALYSNLAQSVKKRTQRTKGISPSLKRSAMNGVTLSGTWQGEIVRKKEKGTVRENVKTENKIPVFQ